MAIVWGAASLVATFLFGWGVGRMHSYEKGLTDGGEIMLHIIAGLGGKDGIVEETNIQRDTV